MNIKALTGLFVVDENGNRLNKFVVAPVKLYVDDVRDCPDGWVLARSFHEAIFLLEQIQFEEVSLDHDLASVYGYKECTGRDILNYLIARKMDGKHTPKVVKVHSANPVACDTMEPDIRKYFS